LKKSLFHKLNRFQSILITIVSIVVIVVIIGEIYVRWISSCDYITPEILKRKKDSTNLIYTASLFSRHVFPQKEHFVKYSISDTFRFDLKEGFEDSVKWYINAKGYRGSDFSVTKPEGKIRIIVYGGSFVFDIRTEKGMDWPHLLQNILEEEGYPIEVINAGIPGHMSFDSFGRFFTEGHFFDPDFVIICNKWNDFKYFRSDEPLLRTFMPMEKSEDPRYHYNGSLDRFLCNISQLYAHLRNQYYTSKIDLYEPTIPAAEYSSEISEVALRQYQLNFQLFVDAARNLGITPILMTQPLLVSRNNSKEQKEIIEYEKIKLNHEGLCVASERADSIVRHVAQTKDAFLIDASKYLSGNESLFTDQVHLTREGANEFAIFTSLEIKKLLKR
jgi:hypothetical protein